MSEPGNKGRIYARIAGTGSYLPEKVLTNEDLSKLVDTSDEWIQSRTGIRERHIAAEGETAGDLGYQAALRALEAAGVDLWALSQGGPEEMLNRTEYTQPTLLAGGIAVWRAWQQQGGAQPAQLAGHSLGEYTALVAEVCTLASDSKVVVPANYNSPGQIVIGGDSDAVERAIALLTERGIRKVVKLAVSVPSHTPLMREAANRLAEVMAGLSWHVPSLPVVQNVDAKAHDGVDAIRDALVRQLYLPVRWTECVQVLAAGGATRIAECGPGKVLAGLVKRIDKGLDARAIGGVGDFQAALADWHA